MKKYLVEVASPAAAQKFDMMVPDCLQVGEFAQLAGSLFSATAGSASLPGQEMIVCDKLAGEILDPNAFIRDLDFKNGTKLLIY